MDTAKAQWVADQLLEASENGVLVPANIVLDAYVRGKVRCDQSLGIFVQKQPHASDLVQSTEISSPLG